MTAGVSAIEARLGRSVPFGARSISLGVHPHGRDGSAQANNIVADAMAAEIAGFDGVTISEHHAGFPGYMPQPVLATNWILGATERVWAAPNPVLLGLRNGRLLAEELAWTGARFPGRLGATVVAGYAKSDFDAIGVDHSSRIRRLPEQLTDFMAALVAAGPLAGDPAVEQFSSLGCLQIGVNSGAAARRAGELGVGVVFPGGEDSRRLGRLSEAYRRSGGAGTTMCIVSLWLGDVPPIRSGRDVFKHAAAPGMRQNSGFRQAPFVGAVADVAAGIAEYLRLAGATAVNLRLNAGSTDAIERQEQIRQVGEQLLPLLRRDWGAGVEADPSTI